MNIDIKKNKSIKSHLKLFKLYKDLNYILPFGYLKTRVSPGLKYSFKKQSILINLEKEKNKDISPTKLTKNLLHNKNIYIFSEENEKTKKIISKLKKYYSYHKPKKNLSIQNENETNFNSDHKNDNHNSNNITNLNSYILNTINLKHNEIDYLNGLNEGNNYKNHLNKNRSRNECDLCQNNNRKCYRSSSINNYSMKNNIYLPSITNRLKNSLPRNQRQDSGFLLNGFGIKNMKNVCINTSDNNFNNYILNNGKNFKFTKNKSMPVYCLSYDNKNDKHFERNVIKEKKNYKSHLYKKKLKIYDELKIIGIKKINKKK